MSNGKGGFIGQDGLNAPDPATGVSASGGETQATVSFTAPSDVGGAAITGYRVQSNDGIGASGSASPVTVTGLTNGTSYTFNVWAINPFGWSSPSDASDSVSPVANMVAFMGGHSGATVYNTIDYINVNSTGNASDWGDLVTARSGGGPASNSTRGLIGAGGNTFSTSYAAQIEYLTWASQGNSVNFGAISVQRRYQTGGCSNDTRGIFACGRTSSNTGSNVMDYVTIATTGNAVDFGDYVEALRNGPAGCSSTTRGVFGGGELENSTKRNDIRYVTIATTGNTTDFGDLSSTSYALGAASSGTRGLFTGVGGGDSNSSTIRYITIDTTGNTTDFGNLTVSLRHHASSSNKTRAVTQSSDHYSGGTTIDYVQIDTTGNATDFGDLTVARVNPAAVANAHGGLS
ncbi:fibronectin type III domain-containing protein [Alphaproteobacteria bacterium]|nr:fibronectin type III domain-containing protein [Alphaproteobacteria bacterium]